MANNYTTSTPSTVEFQGDSVGAGTIPSTYDIIITPDAGYVIQASDFSIGSTLPTEVTTVAFSDTTTALLKPPFLPSKFLILLSQVALVA